MACRGIFSPVLMLSATALLMACQGASSGLPPPAKQSSTSSTANSTGVNISPAGNTVEAESLATPQPTATSTNSANESKTDTTSKDTSMTTPTLRWLNMGDFPSADAMKFSECTLEQNIQRSPCSTANERCRSTFATSCEASSDCRRVFKCTTGQTNSLIWFPMGDGTTTASGLGICTMSENIAGSACSTVNSRCLSSFCTSGSGEGCGRRLFKCLTSGVPGKLYLRWMGDKPESELAGIQQCTVTENIAGSECSVENSNCVSSFYTDAPTNSKRRLFKCTP